jgi:hypothetical protein
MSTRTRKKTGQLATLLDPEFVSVVKSPSNKTGFKIIRSAEEEGGEEKMVTVGNVSPVKTRVRKKRSDTNLLSIDLPTGASLSSAETVLATFNLSEEYEVVDRGDYFSLVRKGSDDDSEETMPIDLGDGIVANVRSSSFTEAQAQRKDEGGVRLVRIDFDSAVFDEEAVELWMSNNAVDFKEGGMSVTEAGVTVLRHDFVETDGKPVKIGDGITGVVVRHASNDVPLSIQRGIVEEVYGNYGWGQMDFTASMADEEFTEESWEAIYALRNVLENIIFYSNLPLAERQALIQNACDQYAAFMSGLIAMLPREVMLAARSDLKLINPDQEINTMSTKVDDKVKDKGAVSDTLTREDVAQIVRESLAAALPEVVATLTKRSDEAEEETKVVTATVADSVKVMGETMQQLRSSLAEVKKELDEVASTTTVTRSDDDDDDGEATEEEEEEETPTQNKRSCFAGMFKTDLGIDG